VESAVGKGTMFTIKLPAATAKRRSVAETEAIGGGTERGM
jgi:hypothetical protein